MYKHVAAEVSALFFAARQKHAGAPTDTLATFVAHDMHAGYRKHKFEMEQIRDGNLNRFDVIGVPQQFNPAAACVDCTIRWCVDAAEFMCGVIQKVSNVDDFDQYSLSIYIAHMFMHHNRRVEDPLCSHVRA